MKTISVCLIILLSVYSISSSLCLAAAQPRPVLDMDGEEVRPGVDYYLLSAFWGAGAGVLTLDSVGNDPCPLDVVNGGSDLRRGLPAYFHPVNPKEGVVRLSTDLNVVFNASSICAQSTIWTLDFDESIQRYIVTTGGVAGNPGPQTISNWFKIQEYGYAYKFVYCPTVCDTCRPVCGDLGIDSTRRLVLTHGDDGVIPFMVLFQKVIPPPIPVRPVSEEFRLLHQRE